MAKEQPDKKGLFGFGGGEEKKLLKELKAEVVQLKSEVQKLGGAVSELSKVVGEGKPIDVQFSWPMDHELLQIVKDIQARLPAADSATKEQIDQILGPAVAGLGEVGKEAPPVDPQP